jgi:hypothetical protein
MILGGASLTTTRSRTGEAQPAMDRAAIAGISSFGKFLISRFPLLIELLDAS